MIKTPRQTGYKGTYLSKIKAIDTRILNKDRYSIKLTDTQWRKAERHSSKIRETRQGGPLSPSFITRVSCSGWNRSFKSLYGHIRTWIVKTIWERRTEQEEPHPLTSRLYYKATVTQIVWWYQKNRQNTQVSGTA